MTTMLRTTAFAAISLLGLAGCATAPSEGARTPQATCEVFQPITWSEQDTRDTRRQVIGHNAAGRAVCGWQPPKSKPAPKPKPKGKKR